MQTYEIPISRLGTCSQGYPENVISGHLGRFVSKVKNFEVRYMPTDGCAPLT